MLHPMPNNNNNNGNTNNQRNSQNAQEATGDQYETRITIKINGRSVSISRSLHNSISALSSNHHPSGADITNIGRLAEFLNTWFIVSAGNITRIVSDTAEHFNMTPTVRQDLSRQLRSVSGLAVEVNRVAFWNRISSFAVGTIRFIGGVIRGLADGVSSVGGFFLQLLRSILGRADDVNNSVGENRGVFGQIRTWLNGLGDQFQNANAFETGRAVGQIAFAIVGTGALVYASFKIAIGASAWFKAKTAGTAAGSTVVVTKQLSDLDLDRLANDIVNINKKFSNGLEAHGASLSSVLHSATYHTTAKSQIAAILQGMSHVFQNGNKRTMVETAQLLITRLNINQSVPTATIQDVVRRIATGDLSGVENISGALFGN